MIMSTRNTNILAHPDEPEIVTFEPNMARTNFDTNMSIIVKNHFAFIQNRTIVVSVAGNNCVNPKTYKNNTINCTVHRLTNPEKTNGPVIVEYRFSEPPALESPIIIRSVKHFEFNVPAKINHNFTKCISTTKGGIINMTGEFLNYTKNVKVQVETNYAQIPCEIILHNSNHIDCRVGPSNNSTSGKVVIFFGNKTVLEIKNFKYIDDPAIETGQTFAGIASGGIQLMIKLKGVDFTCMRNPIMYVDYNGTRIPSKCLLYKYDVKIINCQTPNLNGRGLSSVTILPLTFQVNTQQNHNFVLNATDLIDYLLYPDPTCTDFEVNSSLITINGVFLYNDYRMDDIIIRLPNSNDTICTVFAVTKKSILCKTTTPKLVFGAKDILITIGKSLTKTIMRKPFENSSNPSQLVSALSTVSKAFAFIALMLGLLYCLKTILINSRKLSENRYKKQLRDITASLDEE
ncbi:Hypothetical protein CINCED_3A019675 [Cinara cedri]|nr:Hypothetical protein CINCED_3A019675 [Cinara cedri]